jgi:hypothetical protein
MPTIQNPRLEALAQGLARGLGVQEATREAGYSRQYGVTRRRAEREDVLVRAAEIQRQTALDARDLTPVIEMLTDLAAASRELGTAAAMTAAKSALAEAGRLKALLPHAPTAPIIRAPVLSDEQWAAKWAHLARD